jgi:NitT/TauT family transport system substrate-binding protein
MRHLSSHLNSSQRTPAPGRRHFLRAATVLTAGLSLGVATACGSASPATPPGPAAPVAQGQPTTAPKPTTAPQQAAAPKSPAAGQAASAAPATSAPAAKTSGAPKSVTVGIVGGSGLSPYTAGVSLGIFEKDGLKVEVIEHRGGAEAAQALIGGGVDLFNGDISHALRLNGQGQKIKVVAGSTSKFGYTLMGVKDASTSLADLKGKKIGITSPGSQTDSALRWFLPKQSLAPEKDVELVAIGVGAPMMAALQAGQIYAAMASQPFTAQLKVGGFPVLYDFPSELNPYQSTAMMVKQAYLDEKGDTLRQFLRSYLSVVKTINEDATIRKDLIAKAYKDLDPAIAEAAAAETIASWPPDGRIPEQAVTLVYELDKAARGADAPSPPLSDFSDFSYLP